MKRSARDIFIAVCPGLEKNPDMLHLILQNPDKYTVNGKSARAILLEHGIEQTDEERDKYVIRQTLPAGW